MLYHYRRHPRNHTLFIHYLHIVSNVSITINLKNVESKCRNLYLPSLTFTSFSITIQVLAFQTHGYEDYNESDNDSVTHYDPWFMSANLCHSMSSKEKLVLLYNCALIVMLFDGQSFGRQNLRSLNVHIQ